MAQNADRLNRLQIHEQQLVNRERRRQLEAETHARQRALQSTKALYSHVPSHGYGAHSGNSPDSGHDTGTGGDGRRDGHDGAPQCRVSQGGARGGREAVAARRSNLTTSEHNVGGGNGRGGNRALSVGAAADDDVTIRVYVRECDGERAQQLRYRESDGDVHVTAKRAPRTTAPTTTSTAAAAAAAAPGVARMGRRAASQTVVDVGAEPRGMHADGCGTNAHSQPRSAPQHNRHQRDDDAGRGGAVDDDDAERTGGGGGGGAPRRVVASLSDAPADGLATNAHGRRLGCVPRYLQQRKAELQAEAEALQEAAQQRREQAKLPPGHRLVDDAEKRNTVAALEARRGELERMLGKLPIRYDTQSIQQRRRAIEEELRDADAQMRKYSTTRTLYVPVDEHVLEHLLQPPPAPPPPLQPPRRP